MACGKPSDRSRQIFCRGSRPLFSVYPRPRLAAAFRALVPA